MLFCSSGPVGRSRAASIPKSGPQGPCSRRILQAWALFCSASFPSSGLGTALLFEALLRWPGAERETGRPSEFNDLEAELRGYLRSQAGAWERGGSVGTRGSVGARKNFAKKRDGDCKSRLLAKKIRTAGQSRCQIIQVKAIRAVARFSYLLFLRVRCPNPFFMGNSRPFRH
jgi:hypothetical protein